MKNLVLASALGTAFGAFAAPALTGPVHFQITRPYSLFGTLPANNNGQPVSVVLGTAPLDFIMTDVMLSGYTSHCFVTVNGTPVFNCGKLGGGGNAQGDTHLTSGIFIAAGSTIGVQISNGSSDTVPVTIAGYVQ